MPGATHSHLERDTSWIRAEFGLAHLEDERLDHRFRRLAEELSRRPSRSINHATPDWAAAKAAYRFFENPRVSSEKILESHYLNTMGRALMQDRIIVVQDTSLLDFSRHHKTTGLGAIGKSEDGYEPQGLVFHTALALTETGLPLGLLDHQIWARDEGRETKHTLGRHSHYMRPIEEKESFKWLKSLRRARSRADETAITLVADREADVYELFEEAMTVGVDLIVRVEQDRMLKDGSDYQRLSERLVNESVRATFDLRISGNGRRKPRQAKLEMKYATITLSAHGRGLKTQKNKHRHDLTLGIVELVELEPPKSEQPLHWKLITTYNFNTTKDALEVVRVYKMRWTVEQYFKCLKTGCNVEDCRLGDVQKIINYVSLLSVIAWRILWMTLITRLSPESSCEIALTHSEWQSLWVLKHQRLIRAGTLKPEPPKDPPSVHEALRWLAMQGGFLGRKGDGEPGLITIWRGWLTFMPAVEMYETLLPSIKN